MEENQSQTPITKRNNNQYDPDGLNQEQDDNNISPRSLEQLKDMAGISQLVDDPISPGQEYRKIDEQIANLNIGLGEERFQYDSRCTNFDPERFQEEQKAQKMHFQGGNQGSNNMAMGFHPLYNIAAGEFNPSYAQQQNQEANTLGVNFLQVKRTYSRHSGDQNLSHKYSSDGEGSFHQINEQSDVAIGGFSANQLDDKYSMSSLFEHGSDYHDQLEKFGYIFQSPSRQQQINQQFVQGGAGVYNQMQAIGVEGGVAGTAHHYHHQKNQQQFQIPTSQARASSFDKAATQQLMEQNPFYLNVRQRNEEIETHSAASSGNNSALSDGDLIHQMKMQHNLYYGQHQQQHQQIMGYNQNFSMPNYSQAYYPQGVVSGNGGDFSSNKAYYGYTPNTQVSGSNQKSLYQQSIGGGGNYLQGVGGGGNSYYGGLDKNQIYSKQDSLSAGGGGVEDQTPTNLFNADIQITGNQINLEKNLIGTPMRAGVDMKGMNSSQRQQIMQQNQQDQMNAHSLYKTPSPYRNSDAMMYSNQQMQSLHLSNKQIKTHNNQPGIGNQYPNLYGNIPPQPQRNSLNPYQQYSGMQPSYEHIGMNAPPMTGRGLDFSIPYPDQASASMFMGMHHAHFPNVGGPMVAIQQQYQNQQQQQQQQQQLQQNAVFKQHQPQPLRIPGILKQTNSQERDHPTSMNKSSVEAVNQDALSKTVGNTPTHVNDPNKSVSSQNSNNSQQFSGALMDQNEQQLYQLIKQHDETQNPQQRLEILKGNVHKLALTQTGSRFLQKQLTKANSSIVSFFLEEIGQYLPDLMIDNYGNYFCQKLLSSCSGDQRLAILGTIKERFFEICCNKKGTHTIQTMFDLVNLHEEEEFIRNSIMGNVIRLSMDPQGTHVIQKVISSFDKQKRNFVFEEVYESFLELAMNTNGLCVIKKLITCSQNTEQGEKLMEKISENVIELVQNPYGNYAVTEVINNWENDQCTPIFLKLRGKICQLSSQKFSSNVIERCLEKTDQKIRSMYIEEISNSDKLAGLIRNAYGNYVVQKSLKIAQGKDKQHLIAQITKCIPQITDRKIRQKWEQIVQDAQNPALQQLTSQLEENFYLETLSDGGSGQADNSQSHRQIMVAKRTNSGDSFTKKV